MKGELTDSALAQMYDELRQVARRLLRGERVDHTLQATALVNEAFLRLRGASIDEALGGEGLQRAASLAMRRILVDHARARGRQKRRGGVRWPLDALQLVASGDHAEVLAVDEVIEQLAAKDPEMADLVRLRFYTGFTVAEVAAVRGCSTRTVVSDWAYARSWLRRRLGDESDGAGPQND